MPIYKDADELKATITANAWSNPAVPAVVNKIIDVSPTADAVKVVRCGQCKYWKINSHNLFGGYCRYCEGAKIDHYCSYGERKG